MSLVQKLLGPLSKYDKTIPYTYEARLPVFAGEEEYHSYISDTICGLIEYLDQHAIKPDEVQIYEIYQQQELPLDTVLYSTADNQWRFRPELCQSFKEHYQGHIQDGKCTFEDRDRSCDGP